MVDENRTPKNDPMQNLPFDPFALLFGLRGRWRILCGWAVGALCFGTIIAFWMGKRSWDSYSVLLYQPPTVKLSGRVYDPPAVQTQLNLVKLRPNLEKTRATLQLPVSLDTLASSCDVSNPRDTKMLIIKCRWGNASESAAIANTLAKIFVENQTQVRNTELKEALEYLENRKNNLNLKLAKIQQGKKTNSTKENQEIQREITSVQARVDGLSLLYERALLDRKTLRLKLTRVNEQIDEVKGKIASEEKEAASLQGMSNLNTRVERIREAIFDERKAEINKINLNKASAKVERYRTLFKSGAVSKQEYDVAVSEYQTAITKATDGDKIRELKKELESLYDSIIKPSDKKNAASAPVLRDLLVRKFNLDIEYTGSKEFISKMEQTLAKLDVELKTLIQAQRGANSQKWQIESWREELGEIDKSEAIVNSLMSEKTPDFQLVSPAAVSPIPTHSSRKFLAIASFGVLFLLGVFGVTAFEILRPSVRSSAEVSKGLGLPVVAVLRQKPKVDQTEISAENLNQIRKTTNLIVSNQFGPKILMAGCQSDHGCQMVMSQIAKSLARQNRKVVVIEGNHVDSNDETIDSSLQKTGLSILLNQPDLNPLDHVIANGQSSISRLRWGNGEWVPEMFGSARMKDILKCLQAEFDFVLLLGPSLSQPAGFDFASNHMDSLLIVVDGEQFTRRELANAKLRAFATNIQNIGAVVVNAKTTWLNNSNC